MANYLRRCTRLRCYHRALRETVLQAAQSQLITDCPYTLYPILLFRMASTIMEAQIRSAITLLFPRFDKLQNGKLSASELTGFLG